MPSSVEFSLEQFRVSRKRPSAFIVGQDKLSARALGSSTSCVPGVPEAGTSLVQFSQRRNFMSLAGVEKGWFYGCVQEVVGMPCVCPTTQVSLFPDGLPLWSVHSRGQSTDIALFLHVFSKTPAVIR